MTSIERARPSVSPPKDQAREDERVEKVTLDYTNWKGERAIRTVTPTGIWWGTTDWHPTPGWLVACHDHDRGEGRVYALSGIHSWNGMAVSPSPADPVRAALAPFVAHYQPWMDDWADDKPCTVFAMVTFGDLRRARAALSVSTPTGEGEGPDPVEKIQEIHRRHLNRIIDDWDQHNALDEGEISFLIRMAGNYLRLFTPITLQGETAALAHPPQGGERDGWKLVPVEPNNDQLRAVWLRPVEKLYDESGAQVLGFVQATAIYKAMLAALPTAPLPPSESSGKEASPCHWGGGNDILWCSTCGAEYAYAKGEQRPACPRRSGEEA